MSDRDEGLLACATNLGPRQTRMRQVAGIVSVVLAVLLAVWAVAAGWSPWARLPVLALFGFGALAWIQGRAKT